MREFGSFGEFALLLAEKMIAYHEAEKAALERAAELLEKEAKAKIGEYQPAAGPFAAWAELAPSTQADRVHKGYSANEPLLREGTLRDSIGHQVRSPDAQVGSDSDIAVYQELGTQHIPPRSFLGSTSVENAETVVDIVGEEAMILLAGEDVFQRKISIR